MSDASDEPGTEPEAQAELQTTALTARHQQAGAKMAAFAGWSMPIEFAGTLAEHEAVRSDVGVFDVSHLGTVWVTGSGAREAVSKAFTNDPASLEDGQAQYTLCCDGGGGIIDDLIVYHWADNNFLIVPNAANTAAVVASLRRRAPEATEVVDESRDFAILAVQGPRALEVAGGVIGHDTAAMDFMAAAIVEIDGAEMWVCRSGYTGEPGVELIVPNAVTETLYDRLLDVGATPAGLGARDTLRLEMGYPLHGNDLDTSTSPYEARLGWAVKLDHGPFEGQEALRAAKEAGPGRRLWGLRAVDRGIPRHGMSVSHDGAEVGHVTSGTFSPTLREGIGMAYLADPLGPGDEVEVDVRGKPTAFTVERPPFVERDPRP